MKNKKGLFITIEGGEGSGKTTQSKLLSKWMESNNIKHFLTKEPGTEYLDECIKIRKLLLDTKSDLNYKSELLLFLADRAQHVHKFILPKLEQGIHIICDRYSDSTRVIQSARGLSRTKINSLIEFSTSELNPDITFILDMPVETGLKRAKAISIYEDGDRMESESPRFHENIRQGFLKLAESMDDRYYLINVAPPATSEEIHEKVVEQVKKKLWEV